jgi:hypothetical protein
VGKTMYSLSRRAMLYCARESTFQTLSVRRPEVRSLGIRTPLLLRYALFDLHANSPLSFDPQVLPPRVPFSGPSARQAAIRYRSGGASRSCSKVLIALLRDSDDCPGSGPTQQLMRRRAMRQSRPYTHPCQALPPTNPARAATTY